MKLRITNVNNNEPTVDKEVVRIVATEDVDLVSYALVDNTYNGLEGLSNIHRHFYKFPTQKVNKGDVIRVFTGKGKNTDHPSKDNKYHVYDYFCNSADFIWNNAGDVARILKISEVSKFDVPTKK
jgi:hypothetical protein